MFQVTAQGGQLRYTPIAPDQVKPGMYVRLSNATYYLAGAQIGEWTPVCAPCLKSALINNSLVEPGKIAGGV